MSNVQRLLVPAFAGAAFLLFATSMLAPAATAQVGVNGSVMKSGDADWFPSAKKASAQPQVLFLDRSGINDPTSFCVILRGGAAPGAVGATFGTNTKDIRITDCDNGSAGTFVSAGESRRYTYAGATAVGAGDHPTFEYMDVNGNFKFDNGDVLYLTTSATNGILGRSTIVGIPTFTVRMTTVPALALPAGLARPSDADFTLYGSQVTKDASSTFTMFEREGGWILSPTKDGAVPIDGLAPANSVRLLATQTNFQPAIAAGGIVASTLAADKDVSVPVKATNTGNGAGNGVLVTKIAGRIVDVRMSPVLSPGESANLLVSFHVPADLSGSVELAVNDAFSIVQVTPSANTAASTTKLAADTADLQATIAQLQARIGALESGVQTAHPVAAEAAQSAQPTTSKAPGFDPVLLVAALATLVIVLRRRSA